MNVINKLFWKGLIVVMPVTLSIYLFVVIVTKAESVFGSMLKNLIGPSLYVPGIGIVFTIILMIVVGV